MARQEEPTQSAPEATPESGRGAIRAPSGLAIGVLAGGLAAWSLVALTRVLPFLATSGGDFQNLFRGASSLLVGDSAFARPELDYPPLIPVLLAPIALLPFDEARIAWLLLSMAAVLGAMVATWRLAGGDVTAACAVGGVLALDGTALPNLAVGQTNPLLLLLVAVALLLFRERPRRAAAAIGLAAALKLWPGLLLLSWIPGLADRGSTAGPARGARPLRWWNGGVSRCWQSGLGSWALFMALPWAVLFLSTTPPHLPVAHGYWLGTPAVLNFSAPAAVLRASYGWEPGEPVPHDWEAGVSATWVLARDRQWISVATSLLILAAGLAAIAAGDASRAFRWRRQRLARDEAEGDRGGTAPGRGTLIALVALALVAAPISWYHYQLLQLPAFALALAGALRSRRWASALAIATLTVALTRHEWVVTIVGLFESDPATALYLTGCLMPLFGLVWFVSRVLAIGNGGDTDGIGASGDRGSQRGPGGASRTI